MVGGELPDPGLTCQPTIALRDEAAPAAGIFGGRRNWPPTLPLSVGFLPVGSLEPHVSDFHFSLCQGSWKGDNRAEPAESGSRTIIRREIGACCGDSREIKGPGPASLRAWCVPAFSFFSPQIESPVLSVLPPYYCKSTNPAPLPGLGHCQFSLGFPGLPPGLDFSNPPAISSRQYSCNCPWNMH